MIKNSVWLISICKVMSIITVILVSCSGIWAEEMIKPSPDMVNIDNLDVEEIKSNYSLWELLGEWTIRCNLHSKIKAEASYIDPRAYVLLFTENRTESANDHMIIEELHDVYDKFLPFYIVLKSDDPDSIYFDKWKIFLVDDTNTKYEPIKAVLGKPELTYGYSRNYYVSKAYVYFPKFSCNNRPILHDNTKWMKINIVGELTQGEFIWKFLSDGVVEKSNTDYFDKSFKIGLIGVLIVLTVGLWLTRPPKEWTESAK